MSGEQLRYEAQYGNHKKLRDILKDRANTAQADEYGLTPLMYATWNGHVECVKYLICNDIGVDARGVKVSSLHQKSCKGYTALHLAALDSPSWSSKEITKLLLIAGLDRFSKCNEGYTPLDLARMNPCENSHLAFQEFEQYLQIIQTKANTNKASTNNAATEEKLEREYTSIKKTLLDKYTFIHNPTMNVEKDKLWREAKSFEIPSFIYESQHAGEIPDGMKIHEHQIQPLLIQGESLVKDTIESLKMLEFSLSQADINHARRAKLLSSGDNDGSWEPGRADLSQMRADKARRIIRAHSPYERRRRREERQAEIEQLQLQEVDAEIALLKQQLAEDERKKQQEKEEALEQHRK